ncbi:hypothetical protein Tco_0559439 [Tanacetum coccineum]
MITADSCFYEKWATIDYLTQSLMGYEFYLAPYLQGLAGLVESVVGSLKWEFPLVNRQPGDWECGYYVMKWMHDFVLKYQNENFPNVQNLILPEFVSLVWHYEVVLTMLFSLYGTSEEIKVGGFEFGFVLRVLEDEKGGGYLVFLIGGRISRNSIDRQRCGCQVKKRMDKQHGVNIMAVEVQIGWL